MEVEKEWERDKLPTEAELQGRLHRLPPAPDKPLTDVQQDRNEGIDPTAAPRRAVAKRRPKRPAEASQPSAS